MLEQSEMTQRALAERMGIDESEVSRLIRGERGPGVELATIIRLAQALGVTVGWLAASEGDPGPIPVFREGADRRRKPNRDKSR